MSSKLYLLSLVLLACAPAASAAETTGLAAVESAHCMACHEVRRMRVGPPFEAISRRFAGQRGAEEYLAHTIRSGGRGRWGAVPMPAQPQVTPEQAVVIAKWILSLSRAGSAADAQ
ncbi:MAG TPA: c-type cytochrome [Burkholderiaceae bacterium]|nr:c-type cytochrome [Burkholderiaceae bacterium]